MEYLILRLREFEYGKFKWGRKQSNHNHQFEVGDNLVGTVLRSGMRHGGCASVADWALAETAIALESCLLDLPRLKGPMPIEMTGLGSLGRRGCIDRDINGPPPRGPFDIKPLSPGMRPTYPCLWGHDAKKESHLIVPPDAEAVVRSGMEELASRVWEKATRLHFNRDFRLNSQSLAACLSEPTIGGPAWPNYQLDSPEDEEAMALWANTTLGLLLFWWSGSAQQPGRVHLTLSRLPDMYVLDVRQLSGPQRRGAKRLFKEFRERTFLPANEAYRDEARQDLDRALLVDLLGFPKTILESLDLLRRKWCAEPTVHGGKKTRIQEND